MKTIKKILISIMIFGLIFNMYINSYAQDEKGNKNVIIRERNLPVFTGINVGGVFTIYLKQAGRQSVKVETDENLQDNVFTKVQNNILYITSKTLKKPTKLNIYISVTNPDNIKASGSSTINSESVIKAQDFKLISSGASDVNLNLDVNYLESEISGASDVKLSGKANTHSTEISGAGNLKAYKMETLKTIANISGAGNAKVNAKDELTAKLSGAGSINYFEEPGIKNINDSRYEKTSKSTDAGFYNDYNDSTKIKIGKLNVDIYQGYDSTKIKVGNNTIIIDEYGNVKYRKNKKSKFNGHWAGFDLGVNGYVNDKFNMSFPKEYEYLDLDMNNSITANINFFEQNFNLINNKFGLITGLSLECHNYRFDKNITLIPDSSEIIGYINRGINIKKTKLLVNYLSIPVLFEFQTNSYSKKNSFHFTTGMIFGLRIASHTKTVYEETNKEYYWTKYNPETDKYMDVALVKSPDKKTAKVHDDFQLHPFKMDATVRLGWGWINLFGTYSITTLFKKDKGPELYPFSIGLTLANL
ncbi:MAG: DUF2807 domain-containing protein [Bacteroidales bacterium]|nr:DUF2807 domain-containing protein [Bacteroidales bacterium]